MNEFLFVFFNLVEITNAIKDKGCQRSETWIIEAMTIIPCRLIGSLSRLLDAIATSLERHLRLPSSATNYSVQERAASAQGKYVVQLGNNSSFVILNDIKTYGLSAHSFAIEPLWMSYEN